MKSSPNRLLRGGFAASLAFNLAACGTEGRRDDVTEEVTSPAAAAAKMAKVAIRLKLDPNQTVLDRLDPTDKAISGGELNLHVLKVYKKEDGTCSNTAIAVTLDTEPIPAGRDFDGNVDLAVDLPVGHESTECAAAYAAGPTGRTRGEFVGNFVVGQAGWEFHPDGLAPTLATR